MADSSKGRSQVGSAVLVHGLWGNPEDWRWVSRLLEAANVHVRVPDLPTHRSPSATLADDAEEVRRAIKLCSAPVWSGGPTAAG